MRLRKVTLLGFKSFANKTELIFDEPISAVVGPNGSGKSNVVEAMRFVLGEQSNKSLRSKQSSDLIFKGSDDVKRGNRAEVTIEFDNTDRAFQIHNDDNSAVELGFDTISVSRTVHQDGAAEYRINNSPVRLRDVHELIASVNIGTSGHHIISQGEADRVLTASSRERREMIEDALGLKVYQFRMKDAERKLEKSTQNMREVDLQRKELSPHLRYLKREMERIEKAKALRQQLAEEYREYLSLEYAYLRDRKVLLAKERNQLIERGDYARGEKTRLQQIVDSQTAHDLRDQVTEQKRVVQKVEQDLRASEREAGLIEGRLAGLQESLRSFRTESEALAKEIEESDLQLASSDVRHLTEAIMNKAKTLESESSLAALHVGMGDLVTMIEDFWTKVTPAKKTARPQEFGMLVRLEAQLGELESSLTTATKTKRDHEQLLADAQHKLSLLQEDLRVREQERNQSERELINVRSEIDQISTALEYHDAKQQDLRLREERFQTEIEEGVVLIGQGVKQFSPNADVQTGPELEKDLSDRRRELERKKLKLEDMGAGGGREVVEAYQEAEERDQFLARELTDLSETIAKLTDLHTELEEHIRTSFIQGIDEISKYFHQFFTAMFGGGRANLETVIIKKRKKADDEELEEEQKQDIGIAIRVKLPNKKVAEIDMLSGGERSLTSIALLFALSQVNPPPFLVLDETDAALDEANSRRYGDMLEELSKVAQLIVVTHNRETMSRAQNLYGVTMHASGVSQVLSLKLEEAIATAKK